MNLDAVSAEGALLKARTGKRFSWPKVDHRVTRALLMALYERSDRIDDVERLRGLIDEALVTQARRAFGSPPKKVHLYEVADVLRDQWLPRLSRADLDELAYLVQMGLSGPDRTAEFATKQHLLDFFQRRRLTNTFKSNLRDAFIRAHKESIPVREGVPRPQRNAIEVPLVGESAVDRRKPYPHQLEAWDNLEKLRAESGRPRSGLVVLPTGAGKTYTMVAWLLRQLAADEALRVLWIADQQELVDQAARGFVEQAATMPAKTHRRLRAIHGAGSLATALGDPTLDVACITRQSLLGKGIDKAAENRLKAYLQRPTIVVVDEAHHAVAPTYRRMLKLIRDSSPDSITVGLTATPWPTGFGMTALLEEMFPTRITDVQVRDLILDGVLARPVFHTVHTGESVSLTPEEVKQIAGRDLPPSVLRGLDRNRRNDVIVSSWLQRAEEWGKTLVFACDIQHADNLGEVFRSGDVAATVIHSQTDVRREDILAAFRNADEPSVLISVGMLLEGVDVPDARTAFLTRPTRSRILMRQMIGRVLRGPASGGDDFAHVVDLRDRWTEDIDILAPVDLPNIPAIRSEEVETTTEHRLPPVIDELTDQPIGEDVLRRIEKAYVDVVSRVPHPMAMSRTELVGYYDLDHVNVPVFQHAAQRWAELIDYELGTKTSPFNSPVKLFEDLPVPRPSKADIQEVVEYCRSRCFAPPFREVRTIFSVRAVARDLLEAGAMTETEKVQRLRAIYESTLARSAFFSFQAFFEAVQQEVLSLSGVTENLADPESPKEHQSSDNHLPRLVRRSSRDLGTLFSSTVAQGRRLLAAESENYAELLRHENLPRVDWTLKPMTATWGFWTTRMSGSRRGTPEIRINRQLQAPRTQISDELLEYLLWHELCHHVLPGRGHDAEFRRLESLWPAFERLDHELDTLHERFALGW